MKYLLAILLLCLSFVGQLQAQTPAPKLTTWQDISNLPAPTSGKKIFYGSDSLQFGELRLPEGKGPFPVVVVIHGGCWLNQFNYQYMNHMSAALTKAGYATWNIEFRRVGDEGGGWPSTFLDVAKSIDHVRELAKQFDLDKKKVAVVGHSAGGHLALWAATRQKLPRTNPLYIKNPMKIKGVVSLAGITDLYTYSQEKGSCNSAVKSLMGGLPADVPDRYAEGSPKGNIPMNMPVKLVQGELDPIVPVSQAETLANYSSNRKYLVKLVLLPNAGHFDLVAPTSPAWLAVKGAVREVLY
ncbi:alpha/beta hydrolase family protein [Rufibacter roseus]|uniref:Alpha/beta hydrolase family protein n=1 Tax=Rufibacter roseus TaxID=1567108 RepID=A0ABW2DJG2_9BACT|nr:alpha/beta fold hydrolase [Rufibacter roseus]